MDVTIDRMKRGVIVSVMVVLGAGVMAVATSNDMDVRVTAEVTDEELLEFIEINDRLMVLQAEAEARMFEIIQQTGLTPERYNDIAVMENSPEVESDATEEELEKAMFISEQIHQLQFQLQQDALAIIERSELTPERFQQIGMALQSSPQLQQRLEELLQQGG